MSATAALNASSMVRPVVCTAGLVMCVPIISGGTIESGVALIAQAFDRVEVVADPDAISAIQNAEIDPRAAGGA